MRFRWLGVILCAVLLVALNPGMGAPGGAAPRAAKAQADYSITVRLWQGEAPRPGRYVIGQATGITLEYFWYAATDAQMQDFLTHAALNITLDGAPLFVSPEAGAMWWQAVEPFTLGGQPIRRARWAYTLDALPAGVHTFETTLHLDAAINDGLAGQPFGPGALIETSNVVTVVGGGFALPVGVVVPVVTVPPAAVLPTPVPVYVAPTAAPAAAAPVYPTPVPVPVVPTPVPVVVYVPPAAPAEQWISREESYGGRVVGTLVAEAVAYWYPAEGNLVEPSTVFHPGQTLWVYGMDPTRQFYMVIIDEAYVWIRAGTIGPTNDAVWLGRALPTVIINPN